MKLKGEQLTIFDVLKNDSLTTEDSQEKLVRESTEQEAERPRQWQHTYKNWRGEFKIIWQRKKWPSKYKVQTTIYNPHGKLINVIEQTYTILSTVKDEFELYVEGYEGILARSQKNDSLTQLQQIEPKVEPVRESTATPPPLNAVRTYTPKGTANGGRKYFCYSYRVGHKVKHVHIPGGNIGSPKAQANAARIREAIAAGGTPQEIEQLIKNLR
jgi:hypothetical protein